MEAIILKKNPFAEGNEIITLYSRELGKVRGVARSVKFAKSKLSFGLQALFHSEVEVVPSGRAYLITGVRVLNAFKDLRQNLSNLKHAFYATELLIKSTADEQSNPELFQSYLDLLLHLSSLEKKEHKCLDGFTFRLLALTGYEVRANNCVICEQPFLNGQESYFSNRKSGFVCRKDSENVPDAKIVSAEARDFISRFSKLSYAELDKSPVNLSELRSLSQSFAGYILERDLKSGRFIV